MKISEMFGYLIFENALNIYVLLVKDKATHNELLLTDINYPLKVISRENTMDGEARAALVTQMPRIVVMAKVPPLFLNNVTTVMPAHFIVIG